MRPPTKYDNQLGAKKLPTDIRLRARRRSLISRSRVNVPFAAGALGSQHQRPEEDDDHLIVSLRDKQAQEAQHGAPLQSNPQALQEYLMVLAPQRLHYEIQMASGWDAGFPPEELVGLMQTSSGKGWHTPRIRKIQILSHHYKIASKLDFWMGNRKGEQEVNVGQQGSGFCPEDNKFGDDHYTSDGENYYNEKGEIDLLPKNDTLKKLPVLQFQKLGSISFDSNAGSNYSGRELKSINFDVEGEYLRVVIRQCHVNPLNIYHQVAILALNVLGEPLDVELAGESERLDFNEFEVVNGPGHGLSEASMLPPTIPAPEVADNVQNISDAVQSLSLAEIKEQTTANYLDHDIAKLVEGFLKAKHDAAKVEDFAAAKRYKTGYEFLLKFADDIQELDIEKQKAVENDDFDLAQECKANATAIKDKLMQHISDLGFYTMHDGDTTVVTLSPPVSRRPSIPKTDLPTVSMSKPSSIIPSPPTSRGTASIIVEAAGKRIPISRRSTTSSTTLTRRSSTTSETSSDPDKGRNEERSGKVPAPVTRSLSATFSESPSEIRASRLQQPHSYNPTISPKAITKQYQHPSSLQVLKEGEGAFDQLAHSSFGFESDHVGELTDLERKNLSVCLEVFSEKVVSCLASRELQVRLHALDYVREYLENEHDADEVDGRVERSTLARAVFQVISVGLTDTREKVVSVALTLLDQVVRFCLQNEIPHATAYRSLEPILSLLLIKASDHNTRISQATQSRIVMLCNCFQTHPYSILPLVFRPSRGTVMYRQSQSRIEVVARLVSEYGVYDRAAGKGTPGGLEFENITEFAIPYLSHTNGEVRVAARKLIIDVCKFLNKTRVEQFLPGVKPLIIESIQKDLLPKVPSPSVISPSPSRSLVTHGSAEVSASQMSNRSSNTTKRRQIPTPLGVNLHMDSLKSLLVQPDSPAPAKPSRSSPRVRSETALAHQARVKMPLRSSIRATQALYEGVPRSAVKKHSTLSPDDDNESTESEGNKVKSETCEQMAVSILAGPSSMVSKAPVRQSRSTFGILKPKTSRQDLSMSNRSGHGSSSSDSLKEGVSRPMKERFCVFCDERNSAFTDEGLVAHYWSDCPMLANCPHCKIIIEVPTLSEHMLKECSKRKFIKKCDKCHEIMAADAFLGHVAAGVCEAISSLKERCPLCQIVLPQSDEATWKRHLMRGNGCAGNKKGSGLAHSGNQKHVSPNIIPGVDTNRVRGHSNGIPLSPPSPVSSTSSDVDYSVSSIVDQFVRTREVNSLQVINDTSLHGSRYCAWKSKGDES
ncbi:hypothetical protein BGZ94_004902 [Podila epigama]|nr:hypothetical protein BGZ94_004902 [Podila epigama]